MSSRPVSSNESQRAFSGETAKISPSSYSLALLACLTDPMRQNYPLLPFQDSFRNYFYTETNNWQKNGHE